jgi:hypothetical protein
MSGRGVIPLAPLSVLSFVVWLAFATRSDRPAEPEPAEPPTPPSSARAPALCDEPIAWRVANVDPRFGLSTSAVEAAAREAAELWRIGAQGGLFVRDSALGMPIRLVYDERQARTDERVVAQQGQRRADMDLAAEERELGRAWEAHRDALRRNLAEWADHDGAVAAHNTSVHRWNTTGNAPADTVEALDAVAERLRRRGLRLLDAARTLQAAEEELRSRERALAERRAALDSDAARIASAFPSLEVESGTYLEAQGVDAAGANVTLREIRVFRFEGREDLVGVLAHELGHALGLPHLEEAGAVMSPRRERSADGIPSLHPADRTALEARCR